MNRASTLELALYTQVVMQQKGREDSPCYLFAMINYLYLHI